MTLDHPAALWALLVPAVLLAAALLRPRRTDRPVGSLMIWRRAMRRAGQAPQPVDVLPTFLALLLLGVTGSVLAWAGPTAATEAPARTVRVVVDRSAALRGLRPDGRTRFEEARARAAALLRSLSPHDRAELLIVPDAPVPAAAPAELAAAVEALAPADTDADWERELAARADRPAETVVFTSRAGSRAGGPGLRVELIGGRTDNLAVTRLRQARLPDGRRQIMAEVRNAGTAPATIGVRFAADGAELAFGDADVPGLQGPRRPTVAPGASVRVWWTGTLPAGARTLRADLIGAGDADPADDAAEIRLPAADKLRVAITGAETPVLRDLLAFHPRAERVASPAEADALIAVGVAPPADFAGPAILIQPPGSVVESRPSVERRVLVKFAADPDSAFRHADLADLPVSRLTPLVARPAAGIRAAAWTAEGEPAALEWETSDGHRRAALGFAVSAENLGGPRGVRWTAVLLARLLDSFAEPPAADRPAPPPLAEADRLTEPTELAAGLPAGPAPAAPQLGRWIAVAATAIAAAGWWLAGRRG
jgi:hypothetical protein